MYDFLTPEIKPIITASILKHAEGEKLFSPSQDITLKVSGVNSEFASTFEIGVPVGFDVGAHFHKRTEELFYVTSGKLLFMAFEPVEYTDNWFDWVGPNGERPVICEAGTLIHVPNYTPHAFANISNETARMVFQASPPPDHEEYFKGLIEILNSNSVVDSKSIEALRKKHDVHQITKLRFLDGHDTPDEKNFQ
ncbi:cupin domain-containing protein [Rosenbergiella sp. S61]|uniref:Cupin domain-containing protein n=1 Tax=Rosenbergiella gaditana TaxID=2726987 RepID=A0ABS5T1R4_9GAMM|nr:cupin domain-containing protein [Rosenbergiella gaditana]MBT0725703.1 cupin domain-containing protein [Rosenbergiella gaditana]